ncbi:hypothetical protein KQ945_00895 [Bacillus subtilis subsp. subtilis]|nr:hypothetical protein [Bacillus subtilis subsp. subtilis]
MAEMKFKVKFPDSRPGGTTPVGDWTYHHVLPWRYYYLCAYVLCMAYRYMLIQDNAASRGKSGQVNIGPAIAALATRFWDASKKEIDSKGLKKEFGNDCLGFNFGAELDAAQLWKRIKAIATTAPNQLDTDVRNAGEFSPDAVARACLGPAFGGFWGINGGQRTDDPEELREKARPRSGDLNWWTNLTAIGTALESISPKIQENLPSSRELDVTLKEDAWLVLNNAIAWLVQHNSRAPSFAVADWCYKWNTAIVPVGLNEDYTGGALAKMGKGGKVFRLLVGNERLAVGNAVAEAASDFVRVTENGKRDVLYFRNGEDV